MQSSTPTPTAELKLHKRKPSEDTTDTNLHQEKKLKKDHPTKIIHFNEFFTALTKTRKLTPKKLNEGNAAKAFLHTLTHIEIDDQLIFSTVTINDYQSWLYFEYNNQKTPFKI